MFGEWPGATLITHHPDILGFTPLIFEMPGCFQDAVSAARRRWDPKSAVVAPGLELCAARTVPAATARPAGHQDKPCP